MDHFEVNPSYKYLPNISVGDIVEIRYGGEPQYARLPKDSSGFYSLHCSVLGRDGDSLDLEVLSVRTYDGEHEALYEADKVGGRLFIPIQKVRRKVKTAEPMH